MTASPRRARLLLPLLALPLAATGLAVGLAPAHAATTDVRINEIESNGDATDWIEVTNTGAAAVDISGWVFKDDDDTHMLTAPAGTSLAPGGYFTLDTNVPTTTGNFGLGAADAARLFLPDGTTLIDSYSWTAHAATTYGRCPNGTGAFTTTAASTKNAANACPTAGTGTASPTATASTTSTATSSVTATSTTTATSTATATATATATSTATETAGSASPWPGGQSVATVDPKDLVTSNLSGLVYEGAGSGRPATLWAVQNGPGTLFKLQRQGSTWAPVAGDFAAGKALRYTAAGTATTENPDAEGVTITDQGSAAGVFVSTERNNAVSGVSRLAVLRYNPDDAGTSLVPNRTWDLTSDIPATGANLGLEAITWVPDSYLVGRGFRTAAGAPYVPSDYPDHGTGLFFVGVEGSGMVYGYALDQSADTFTRITSFASGLIKTAGGSAVMELNWEPESQKMWAVCDDSCGGVFKRFGVDSTGNFAAVATYNRPTGMPNLNNEGFATTPQSECVGGRKPVFFADDGDTDGYSLREGTLSCVDPATVTATAGPGATVTVTPTVTATPAPPATAPAAQDRTLPRVKVAGVDNGGFYPGKAPKLRCRATDRAQDATGIRSCVLKRKVIDSPFARRLHVVKAVAIDNAGNVSRDTRVYFTPRR